MKIKTSKIIQKMLLILLLIFINICPSTLQGQLLTVTPTEYPHALTNPLMGFRQDLNNAASSNYKYTSVVRHYIRWNEIENSESDDVQKIIDFCNQKWGQLPSLNVKVIPRVYIDWDNASGNEYWPADILIKTGLSANDPELWKTQIVRDRIEKLIEKLGKAWDNDPRVAWIQTGIVGYWGEQESPYGVHQNVIAPDNSNYAKILGTAFEKAFPNKIKLVRNHQHWTAEGFKDLGVYWDSFAHVQQYTGAWTSTLNVNSENFRYLLAPMEGEVAYNWGSKNAADGRLKFADPMPGFTILDDKSWDVNSTHRKPDYYNFIVNSIKQLHSSAMGWISSYTPGADTETGTNLIQKAFGYRFFISEFKCSARTEPGNTLTMSAKVKNIGSAVFHENWPVAFVIVNEATRNIVFQSVINGTDTRLWKPGSNFDWDPISNVNGTKVYLTPAEDVLINASITIPSTLLPGQYLAGLAILDPSTNKPGVFFAVNSFFKESQTQPLCRIGIGADVTNNTITARIDHPVDDDMRYYNTTPPSEYSITAIVPQNGSISPNASTIVNLGESKTYTILPNNGFEITDVIVDGLSKGAISTYTFTNVRANHSISAVFNLIGSSITVLPNGLWIQGLNHVKETGTNRAFVVMVYGEGTSDISASSVSYGGQPMTKVVEKSYLSGSCSYTGAFVMNDAGIEAATSGAISVSWTAAPSGGSDVTSAFFSNVNQNSLFAATASNGIVTTTITTPELASNSGDMVVVGGTAANNSIYTLNNGFLRGIPETSAAFGDLTSAYKISNGNTIIPSLSLSWSMRQTIVSFVLNKSIYTSSKGLSDNNNVIIYPNPVTDKLNINLPMALNNEIKIFSNIGMQIFAIKTKDASISIDVKSLNYRGVVMVQVISDNIVSAQKVIIE